MSGKVFVGNLSFKTREADLAKEFEIVGKVKTANIIAKGPKSLGYGFVEYETAEDAQKAVTQLNQKEIDGRKVNVESARPRTDTQAQRPPRTFPPRRQFRGPAQPVDNNAPQQAPVQQGQPPYQNQQRGPRRFPPRPYNNRFPRQQTSPQGQQPIQQRPFRRNNFRSGGRRPPRVQGDRDLSKTTLFVANLPWVVDDAGLNEIFEGMNVKEAHVVIGRDGRSRGYGFVTFDNEVDQSKALQTVDKSLVENREISVTKAFQPPPAKPEEKKPEEKKTEAPKVTPPVTPEEKKPEEKKPEK
jgi:RNA recognition motif-containing protein